MIALDWMNALALVCGAMLEVRSTVKPLGFTRVARHQPREYQLAGPCSSRLRRPLELKALVPPSARSLP